MARETTVQREQRLRRVAELALRGLGTGEIAKETGLTTGQVAWDMKVLVRRWRELASEDIADLKAKELAKLDRLEAEYWRAWEASKRRVTKSQRKSLSASGATGGGQVELMEQETAGDAKFLDGVARCIAQRCRLLGIDAPSINLTQHNITITDRNEIQRRLEKYADILEIPARVKEASDSPLDGPGQPVDSPRPTSEASGVFDAAG